MVLLVFCQIVLAGNYGIHICILGKEEGNRLKYLYEDQESANMNTNSYI